MSVQRKKKTSAKIVASRSEPVLEGMVGREKQRGFDQDEVASIRFADFYSSRGGGK